jgi:recombination protein RecR
MIIQPLEELVDALCKLPSIGRKSAWRLALHLMERPESEVANLAESLLTVRRKVVLCKRCFSYSESEICLICSSVSREQTCICIVERPVDVFTIERSGRFRGVYHTLGGVLSPLNGITVDKLRIAELRQRITVEKPRELIICLGGSADAETTSLYIARIFRDSGLRITRLARGLPAGMELEYVDQITLSQALNERTDITYGEK